MLDISREDIEVNAIVDFEGLDRLLSLRSMDRLRKMATEHGVPKAQQRIKRTVVYALVAKYREEVIDPLLEGDVVHGGEAMVAEEDTGALGSGGDGGDVPSQDGETEEASGPA